MIKKKKKRKKWKAFPDHSDSGTVENNSKRTTKRGGGGEKDVCGAEKITTTKTTFFNHPKKKKEPRNRLAPRPVGPKNASGTKQDGDAGNTKKQRERKRENKIKITAKWCAQKNSPKTQNWAVSRPPSRFYFYFSILSVRSGWMFTPPGEVPVRHNRD